MTVTRSLDRSHYDEKSSGHGGGPTVSQAIDQNAAVYAFLAERLGMPLPGGSGASAARP